MPAEDARRLERFRDILAGLRAEASLRPLDALIDRAISAFDYDLAILAEPDGARRMANVRKLMRLAAEYEEHDGRDLRGFLDFADERTRRDEREGMAAVQVEGHDGVRVMTVHAAKGLEFPVVAVADLGRGLGAGSRAPDVAIGRLPGAVGDPAGTRFGMRLPVAAAESLRLWELVELCHEERGRGGRGGASARLRGRHARQGAPDPERHLPLLRPRGDGGTAALAHRAEAAASRARRTRLHRGRRPGRAPPRAGDRRRASRRPRDPAPVRVQRPSVERAAELRRGAAGPRLERRARPEPAAALLPQPLSTASAGHLSYSALADYAGCGYRFYVERVLGLTSPHEATPSERIRMRRRRGPRPMS